jgi:hypothetical protein
MAESVEAKENQPSRLLEISVRAQDAAGDLLYIDRFRYAAAESRPVRAAGVADRARRYGETSSQVTS